ncbi:MAG TPA: hypothetical protein VD837_09825 [Terriglobales bacterium]|nr:hypothetical protein [Terriglobales bacterium]
MRRPLLLFGFVLLSVVVAAQLPDSIDGSLPAYGVEGARLSMPIMTTPVVSLNSVSPAPVGASNATAGLSAGATNATLSDPYEPTSAVTLEPQFLTSLGWAAAERFEDHEAIAQRGFDTGAAQFRSAYGLPTAISKASLGEIARGYRQRRPAQDRRVYTNEDIERLNRGPSR